MNLNRILDMSSFLAHAKRTKTGIQKKTEGLRCMVSHFSLHIIPGGTQRATDTDKEGAVVDPLAALDKTVTAKHQIETVEKPRIESLQSLSEHYNSDPYSLSLKARKRFREEKKIEQAKAKADTQLKDRYGLATELTLVRENDDLIKEAKTEWQKNRAEMESVSKRRKLGVADTPSIASSSTQLNFSKSSAPNTLATLRARILKNTAKQSSSSSSSQSKLKTLRPP